ncbi:peptide methionine sulfoxide reductase MsrA [Pseudanabaena sp. lw0831]|uniref:peptide-methionine (S)-S-oxide reductase MsrA n=1 Tax=Pseudanabaena sp. lw0831 TaxID=1357935 RepID=UPI001915657B|nr:peptide-methionine (S)-S-oxide reductase MsrA [Pseudanabaena sp. lw0831]GBO55397.1 peptide methionine sulfoxide reductase MsrA [Pseudanabaena sp. lw0831]
MFQRSLYVCGGIIGSLAIASLFLNSLVSGKAINTEPRNTESSATQTSTAIPTVNQKGMKTAVFAGGCFWGTEAVFEHLKGVSNVVSGYSGGSAATANYEAVGSGRTGHAESIRITYDPSQISYEKLLEIYFYVAHDPTQLNRQGPDRGTQYRSAIFFANSEQQQIAAAYIERLNQTKSFSKPVVTQLAPLESFYAAEDYHQDFIVHNPDYPYVVAHDLPKLAHLRKQFPEIYKY